MSFRALLHVHHPRVFLKGTPLALLWEDMLALFIFATVLVVVATRAFQKRLR